MSANNSPASAGAVQRPAGTKAQLLGALALLLALGIIATLSIASLATLMPRGTRLGLAYVLMVAGLCSVLYARASAWTRTEDPASAAANVLAGLIAALASACLLWMAHGAQSLFAWLFDFVGDMLRDTAALRRLTIWVWFVFFVVNALVLLGYVLLRWILVLPARWMFARLRRRRERWVGFFTNTALHVGLLIFLIANIVTLFLIAFWVAAAPATTVWRIPNEVAYFPWVATVVLIAELAGSFRAAGPATRTNLAAPWPAATVPDAKSVEGLYQRLAESDSSVVMWADKPDGERPSGSVASEELAQKAVAAMRSERARSIVDNVRRSSDPLRKPVLAAANIPETAEAIDDFIGTETGPRRSLLLLETLTSAHFTLFAELVLDTLDEGGVALCLCPDTQVAQARKGFADAFAATGAEFVVDMLVPSAGAKAEEALHHLIILGPSELDRYMLAEATRREKEVRRLALVMVLDLHLMDMAKVSLSLRRLWQSVPFKDVRLLVGCSGVDNIEIFIKNHLHAGTARPVGRLSLFAGKTSELYRIAIASNAMTAKRLVELLEYRDGMERGGIGSIAALTALLSIKEGFVPVIHDPLSRWQFRQADGFDTGEPWSSDIASAPLLDALTADKAAAFRKIEVVHYLPDRDSPAYARVVIVEAGDNWFADAARSYCFPDSYDTLVVVVIKRTELLPYTYHAVDQRGSGLGPPGVLAPAPGVGPAELAYIMQDRLNSASGLRLSALENLFKTFAASDQLMENAQIGSDQMGIRRAFEWTPNAPKVDVKLEIAEITGEPAFRVSAEIALPKLLEVRKDGEKFGELVAGDFGLVYARGTTFHIGGGYHVIQNVGHDGSIGVTAVGHDHASQTRRPSPRIQVHYTLDFKDFVVANAPPPHVNDVSTYGLHIETRTILAGRAQRRTVGFYDEYENEPPFDIAGNPVRRSDQQIAVRWRSLEGQGEELATARNVRVLHIMYARSAVQAPDGPRVASKVVRTSRANYAARQAHTLCILWKELIRTSFPIHASRVTVVSPQVEPLHAALLREPPEGSLPLSPRGQYAVRQYGRVTVVNDPLDAGIALSDDQRSFLAEPTTRRIDIYVIEDADWDLGVVRAIAGEDDLFRHLGACVNLYGLDPPAEKPIGSHGFLGFGGRDRDPTLLLGQLKWVLGMEAASQEPSATPDTDDDSTPPQGDPVRRDRTRRPRPKRARKPATNEQQ
jgi:hypothetical protein